jgi:hypothetical protein
MPVVAVFEPAALQTRSVTESSTADMGPPEPFTIRVHQFARGRDRDRDRDRLTPTEHARLTLWDAFRKAALLTGCTIYAPAGLEENRKPLADQGFSVAVPVGFEPT